MGIRETWHLIHSCSALYSKPINHKHINRNCVSGCTKPLYIMTLPRKLFPRRLCRVLSGSSRSSSSTFSSSGNSSKAPPISVGVTKDAGRGVFATRRIGCGDLIHTADPFLVHPFLDVMHKVCYYCLRRIDENSSNMKAFSCSMQCQNSERMTHNENHVNFCCNDCEELAKSFYQIESKVDWTFFHEHCREKGLKYPLLIKRFASMIMSGTATVNGLDILQPANGFNLAAYEWEDDFELLVNTLKASTIQSDLWHFLTKQWYSSVWARIRANVFRIELIGTQAGFLGGSSLSIFEDLSVGNAVYILPSMYNHDCDPNTHILWLDSAKAKLKALRDIETGEELRICYTDASLGYEARQSFLYQGYGFICNCLKCKEKE